MKRPFLITTALSPLLGAMTPEERAAGRFMRAPDGHEGGDGGNAGEANAGSDAGAAASGEGGGDAGAAGAAADAGGGDTSVLGGAGEGGADAGTGDGEGEGEAGDKADGAKEGEAASGPPEKYELTPPDGFEAIDTEVLAEAEPVLKDLNLSNEQANKLMPIAGQLVKKTLERAEAAINERAITNRREWAEAFESDPEIGGANKDKTIALAAKAFDHYGIKAGEGVRALLDESGLGNHPDLIRFVARVGADLEEGSFERGGAASPPKAPEQKMYGPEFQPKG